MYFIDNLRWRVRKNKLSSKKFVWEVMKRTIGIVIFGFVWVALSCGERKVDNPLPNQPPETYLFLFTDTTLNTTTSRQILHWWGDDPDGFVVGYRYSWDPTLPEDQWTWTTQTSDTFSLAIPGADTVYVFSVRAVDDQGLSDPTPATQRFPVKNTPPEVQFLLGFDVPETTFTVASFFWKGTDLDGDETIEKYLYALDDTSRPENWRELPPTVTFLTLHEEDGLTEGEHVFYLKAVDIAQASSPVIRMPPEGRTWYVKKPRGRLLLIDDYAIADNSADFYRAVLDTLVGEYTVWDIKIDRDGDRQEDFLPPSKVTFTETLLLFDYILWYTDSNPHFEEAQVGVPEFLKKGGKILFSASFPEFFTNQGDPLGFTPVDSVSFKIQKIINGTRILPQRSGYPELQVRSRIGVLLFVQALVPKPSAHVVYTLPEGSAWPGNPVMAVIDAHSTFMFIGLPIHALDGLGTASLFIKKVLVDEFGF